ncbi:MULTISPECIES: hypothetical protein [unclassified Nostoc]|uniref:hypothetical protein n=1 Tax=unclassified Nostoc TaxID=2593658 RepID=UPI0018F04D01|nr:MULTISPECIES: hypothetical protein [unclassified Nostoc]
MQSKASLHIKTFAQLWELVVCNVIQGIFNCIKLLNNTYDISKNHLGFEFSLVLRNNKIIKFQPFQMAVNVRKTITESCKINDQLQSFRKIGGGHSVCQEDTTLNRQHSSKPINSLFKLYRSTLVKYRYTSLELAVRSAALMAYAIANFHTDNPVKVGSNAHNQEQCKNQWALSNYS